MADYTEQQLKDAARRALADGNEAAAKRLVDQARTVAAQAQSEQPQERGFWHRIGDNVIGYDDGVMSAGEQAAATFNNSVDTFSMGLLGDEANAATDALVGRGDGYQAQQDSYRQQERDLRENNPTAFWSSEIAPALIPGVGAAGAVGRLGGPLAKAFGGGAAGFAAGGVDGFMSGEGGVSSRANNALIGGVIGGGAGAVAGPIAQGVGAAWRRAGPGAARTARRTRGILGLDDTGAQIVGDAVQRDAPYRSAQLSMAGPDAVNAMSGPNSRGLLDAIANRPGEAGAMVTNRVNEMAGDAGQRLRGAMDDTLGAPRGVERAQRELMQDTASARRTVYDAAYSRPIDYSAPQARDLEGMLKRVPAEAVRRAERLMATEGVESGQILARVGDDGKVVYERMPDVRQIDYITRALRDMGGFGVGEGAEQGRAYANLATNLRRQLDDLVPEYKAARATGQDVIANREALSFGESLLRDSTRLDVAEDAIAQMTDAEKEFAAQGIRSELEHLMGNAKRALTDSNMDAREAMRPLASLSSGNNRKKIEALLGKSKAKAFLNEVDRAYSFMSLRAGIAQNSKTQPRQAMTDMLNENIGTTAGEALREGRGLTGAAAEVARPMLESGAVTRAMRQDNVLKDVANVLLEPTGRLPERTKAVEMLSPILRQADEEAATVERRARGILGGLAGGAIAAR